MESKCLADKQSDAPRVPIKTYQWEDLRRAREAGSYPWTHLHKPSLLGEITANDILRESTPQRSMSRERSRTRSPCGVTIDPSPRIMSKDGSRSRTRSPDEQRILLLDASPGSCRKLGEEGEPVAGIHVPNFSKEVSLDSDEYQIDKAIDKYVKIETSVCDKAEAEHLQVVADKCKSVSPKGILKRRLPERSQNNRLSTASSASGSKCCHPIVEKIKYIADKTLHKHDRDQASKDPSGKKHKGHTGQEILQLKSSPRIERKKFAILKMGDSDEVSKIQAAGPSPINKKRKDHIYEDIEQSSDKRFLQFASERLDLDSNAFADKDTDKDDELDGTSEKIDNVSRTEIITGNKSDASQDPSLQIDEDADELQSDEHIMESLHQHPEYVREEAIILDIEDDTDGTGHVDISEVLEQVDQNSPNITISEIIDDVISIPEAGYLPEESVKDDSPAGEEVGDKKWSAPNSDHEYELIGKPPESAPTTPQTTTADHDTKDTAEDELSSIASLDRKYLQHSSDDEGNLEPPADEDGDEELSAEALQKTIEDRYFLNTPSTTASRTECDISTSQVESSALENLPLKRGSRDGNKIQQSIKAQTVKLKSQAGKLRTKLQSIKNKRFSKTDKPRFHLPDRPKFHMPERPKFSFPDKARFSLPDRKKFTLPERPKFKKINISLPEKNRFTLPGFDRPKFPDMPKFKMPEKAKINFSSLGRAKKETSNDDVNQNLKMESTSEPKTQGMVFESKTFPRIMSRTKKQKKVELASSDPALNRPGTPPPTFSFISVSASPKSVELQHQKWDDNDDEEPRSYGQSMELYDADLEIDEYNHVHHNDGEQSRQLHHNTASNMKSLDNKSLPNISGNESPYTHVDEINTDEFFIRPKGISRENIEVRKYLSDEIREAFKAPANALAQMDTTQTAPAEESICESRSQINGYGDVKTDFIEIIEGTSQTYIESDDGYYTFPPVRPSRAKKTKKKTEQPIAYIEQCSYTMPYNEYVNHEEDDPSLEDFNGEVEQKHAITDSVDDDGEQTQTALAMPSAPIRRKRSQGTLRSAQGSLNDFYQRSNSNIVRQWNEQKDDNDDIIVYRTEHQYTMAESTRDGENGSPVPPRRSRNRSRDSRTTSLGDDDRTSHGAESLTLDPHMPAQELEEYPDIKRESPGYATVDKCPPPRKMRRSRSKTPPVAPRKSHSSERKYFTVDRLTHLASRDGLSNNGMPPRPRRKKSSTSLVTLDSLYRTSSGDVTQYVEINDNEGDYHRKLQRGEVINKMKDRPLPPPPRPPRSERRTRDSRKGKRDSDPYNDITSPIFVKEDETQVSTDCQEVIEIEVSTQTDPLPDDIDFELGVEECLDEHVNTLSMSSSLKDIIDADVFYSKNDDRTTEADYLETSRPTSRTSRGAKDPKIRELTRSPTGRISPTVILVERRVSSPTRINNRDEIVMEASLTVQHINVDESKIPEVPPLPQSNSNWQYKETLNKSNSENKIIEKRMDDRSNDVQLDSLVTQRLQVTDLDVGRLNVAELQAGKILVSEIEGLTLQVSELDSKSGHINVSGVQLAPEIIEEIVRKFAEITARTSGTSPAAEPNAIPVSREEETQTDLDQESKAGSDLRQDNGQEQVIENNLTHTPPPSSISSEPPQRPPPPDLSPLLLSYLQELSVPPASFYHLRSPRERPFTDYYETHPPAPPPPPARRAKRKTQMSRDSSSDEEQSHGHLQGARRGPSRGHDPTLTELGAQFWRVCHTSVTRTVRHLFTSLMSYVSGCEDKKDVQMAVVIFLVLIAGLIMFGLSDGRTVHHHHWEFFNPPDGK